MNLIEINNIKMTEDEYIKINLNKDKAWILHPITNEKIFVTLEEYINIKKTLSLTKDKS